MSTKPSPRPGTSDAGGAGHSGDLHLVISGAEKTMPEVAVSADTLAAALAKDLDGSFEQLVRDFQDRLFSFALRLTGRREDAEEVTQDAFVRAYRALQTYPAARVRAMALKAWLYQVTLNAPRRDATPRMTRACGLTRDSKSSGVGPTSPRSWRGCPSVTARL
jgi:hypothetical protein